MFEKNANLCSLFLRKTIDKHMFVYYNKITEKNKCLEHRFVSSGFFGHNLMQAMAEEEAAVSYSKYYTSIRLEEGNTLWKLAERYNNHSEKSMEAYVRELKSMNCLIDDTIHAGNYLTVTYYKAEPEDY